MKIVSCGTPPTREQLQKFAAADDSVAWDLINKKHCRKMQRRRSRHLNNCADGMETGPEYIVEDDADR